MNRHGGHALAVGTDQHDQTGARQVCCARSEFSTARWQGLNSAGNIGACTVRIRARPEPPSSTPTGRISLVTGTANMVLSFRLEGEHRSPRGNLEFPVRECSDRERPSGSVAATCGAPFGHRWRILGTATLFTCQNAATHKVSPGRALHADELMIRRRLPGSALPTEPITRPRASCAGQLQARPGISQGQVTTATPDGLDFRRIEIPE